MTLTQLNAFVLVARLGSVTAAANALGVSEPAVSQALSALRQHLGDQLVSRGPAGHDADRRAAPGCWPPRRRSSCSAPRRTPRSAPRRARPEQLRVVATSTIAEFVVSPLMEAFTRRFAGAVEVSAGVAVTSEMAVLVANRLADVAIGPAVTADPALPVVSEPIFRYRLVVVTAGQSRLRGNARQWRWLVDPSGTDPGSDTGQLLAALRIPESRIGVFPNQTAAWAAAADGGGRGARPSSTWSPSSCAGASCRWSRCPGTPVDALLARDPAGAAEPQHGRQRAAPLPEHPRGHAPDALPGGRGPAVPVPARRCT